MATYAELAPTLQKLGITKISIEEKIVIPAKEEPVIPAPTKAQAILLRDMYLSDGIEKCNGFLGLAKRVGITVDQVKTLVSELDAIKADYIAKNVVVEVEELIKK